VPIWVSERLREQVNQADHNRCAYCQTSEANCGIPLTIDHIQPISRGGETSFENLCLACRPCNEFKATLTEAEDPLTGETVRLFNPRSQTWSEHFRWSADGTRVEGLTGVGRATVIALQMNREAVLATRARWVWGGWHPPID
jgi:hypothetical protein